MGTAVTATFVFTDLVDSTATAARLGPEAAEELRQTHFRLLRGAVSASGGTEVKNLGDGLMVMNSSPSRALSCAAGMQQAIEQHNRTAAEPLSVRIGVSVGEAIEEDGDFFGDPVVEAARLCAVANGGQILATDVVRALVGRHATQTFVDLGDIELKGIPDPVPVVDVLWEPMQLRGSVPLPGRLVGAASDALFGFFGRAAELDTFDEASKRARASERSQTVLVSGEPGMGKTTLVAQAARAAHERGGIVLFGHAQEDLGVAYQPWIEVVATLHRHGEAELIAGLRSAQRSALTRLVPDIGGDEERIGDPDTERMLLLEAIVELLAAASRDAGVLVVLDDVHWADTASLQVLRHLITSSVAMNVVIACTYRDTDLGRHDPLTLLLADLHREANVVRLALGGLGDTEIQDLLAAAAGHELDEDGVGLAHVLRRETEGNPFFTGEILRHLGESGGIVLREDGRWVLSAELEKIGLPTSVRDVVGRRVARLGDEAIRVLSLAAVIGRDFDLDVLGVVADVDEDALLDLMDAGVAAAVLTDSGAAGRYRFAHALIQHSLYDEISSSRRRRAHERIAEALESSAAEPDAGALAELAHHWVAATRPTQVDKAFEYVCRAGDAARDGLAPDDAARWYRQALDLLDQRPDADDRLRAGLLAELGTAQGRAGQPEYRDTLRQAVTAASAHDDADALVRAALGYSSGATMSGDEEAKAAAHGALDRLRQADDPSRPLLLAACAGAYDLATEWPTRRDLSLQALGAARELGDPAVVVAVTSSTQLALATPDRLTENIADLEDAVTLARQLGDPALRFRSLFDIVWARYQQYDIAAVDSLLVDLETISDRVGLPRMGWEVALLRTGRLLLAGRVDEAEVWNERALEIGLTAAAEDALGAHGGLLYNIRQQQGRLEELAEFFVEVARDNPSIVSLRSALPKLLAELGRFDEARARLAQEAADGFELPFVGLWMDAMENLLEGAAIVGDEQACRVLVERAGPYADHVIAPTGAIIKGVMAAPLARAATIAGDFDVAEPWFERAHDLHRRLDAPFWLAKGQLDHARLCLTRGAPGDADRARELIATALATSAEFSCVGLSREADALLADL